MKTLLFLSAALISLSASAQTLAPRQDPAQIRSSVEQFLRVQTTGLPGEVQITVGQLDARLSLPACQTPEAFLPAGSRVWGRTSVGVRCTAPSPWTVYVTAQVKVIADYVASAIPLSQGQLVGPNDVIRIRGDLTLLPAGVLTDPAQAIGRTVAGSVGLGSPLRQDSLKTVQAVQQGQAVRVVSTGPGFSVATDGRALNNAVAGQIAQAKTAGGQVVSGVARAGGIVDVTY
ncbi:flagella basal body P-ring formation protein FlgA [Actimicrobium sp. GrIS 1.19]|uniref:flagellar basal body P-ring formation chaperone FlgA n=1 Tax=Actimicrobium sp. GrIS 1.19 TaxID=3071708 RepID=UPI002E00BAE3|nr:flagella basal body P-ring formation protein FlgA [Actimicrobium sp. GrIS 1.19]